MYKALSLVFFIGFYNLSFASEKALQLPADVAMVSSRDGAYDAKYSNSVRYRLSVKNALGGEGSQIIVFEKFAPGKFGSSDKILFQKEVAVTSLPKVKEMIDEISKKSVEATYGCCEVKEVNWKEYQVQFKIQKDSKSFSCESTEFSEDKFKIACK